MLSFCSVYPWYSFQLLWIRVLERIVLHILGTSDSNTLSNKYNGFSNKVLIFFKNIKKITVISLHLHFALSYECHYLSFYFNTNTEIIINPWSLGLTIHSRIPSTHKRWMYIVVELIKHWYGGWRRVCYLCYTIIFIEI